MKIKIMILLTLSSISLVKAEDASCLREKWSLINEEISRTCDMTNPINLRQTQKDYPLMSAGPFTVRYWEGGFRRTTTRIQTFKHTFINVCNGQTTYSEIEKHQSEDYVNFNMKNSNLDLNITESFRLAPMTELEAKVAFDNLKNACELTPVP